ncbi:MAG: YdcF family protein [Lachnospiraceae bacterium]|nr:YdcF family protein [Lachnospiraceae bacterium]
MNQIISDISDFIFVSDTAKDADIIMVPGGSWPELPETAATLYREGFSKMILISGGISITTSKFPGPKTKSKVYTGDYQTEYEFYKDVLLKNDVPEEAIIGEDQSSFIRENSLYARQLLDEQNLSVRSALLVCKSVHARRTLMSYQAAFPSVEFSVIAVPGYDITKDNWFLYEESIVRVLGELARIGDQFTVKDINQFLLSD